MQFSRKLKNIMMQLGVLEATLASLNFLLGKLVQWNRLAGLWKLTSSKTNEPNGKSSFVLLFNSSVVTV